MNSAHFRTIDPELLAMLGEQADRLDNLYKKVDVTKSKAVNHKNRLQQDIEIIEDGVQSARLVLPLLSKPYHQSRSPQPKSHSSRLSNIYGGRNRSLVTSAHRNTLPVTQRITAHLSPGDMVSQRKEQKMLTNLDAFYVELHSILTKPVPINQIFHFDRKSKQLKKQYSHLNHFNKEYYLTHCKLDLTLVDVKK